MPQESELKQREIKEKQKAKLLKEMKKEAHQFQNKITPFIKLEPGVV